MNVNLSAFDGEATPQPTQTNSSAVSQSGSEGQTIVYGKQESTEPQGNVEQTQETTPEQRFEALINGEYKDAYAKTFQKSFNERFKDVKQMQSKLGEITPIVDLLMEKHGVKTAQELFEKLESESIEEMAYKNNMDPEVYKKVKQLEKENERFKQDKLTIEQEQARNQQISDWIQQETEVKKLYPEFNLQEWAQNDQFARLIQAGVKVQQAYEVCNIDGIKESVAKSVKSATIESVKANGINRPKENANSQSQGLIVKNDVKNLTKEDRAEIAQRAKRGATIRF